MHFLAVGDFLGLLTLGAALGFFGGLFGIGGGIIAIPMLVLAFGMEQALAQGTSLAMMVPILAMGLWRYSRKRSIPWRSAVTIGFMASVTTWVVARYATQLNPDVLRDVFGVFLVCLSAQMLMAKHRAGADGIHSRLSQGFLPSVGIAAGTSMGLLGVGGGLVATPLLMSLFGQRQTQAQSLSMALVTPCAVVALATYSYADCVDWSMGLPLAFGGLVTVSAGVAAAHKLPERQMRILFALMLIATAVWLLIKP
jgi:uncharacterized membrane protein YfcA